MIYKAKELDIEAEFSVSDARLLLSKTNFKDYDLIDRFNLERLLRNLTNNRNTKVLSGKKSKLKVGWGFNFCISESIADRNVTENILEVPILHELLARNCFINYIGKSVTKFEQFHSNMKDYSDEWRKLPKPYKPIASWIEDCIEGYEDKYEMELPKVDFVIMNAFPSFFHSNMMFYLINLHYAKSRTPVFLWDIEQRTLKMKEQENFSKYFKYSGADKIFSKEQFASIVDNGYWLVQIPGVSLDKVRSLNPRIRIMPFFPSYDLELGLFEPNDKPAYRIVYIGNDSERKQAFKKYFSPLSKKNRLNLFGGGMSQRHEGYKDFESYKGNTKMHGPIEQDQVWRMYNLSRTCLSISRQRYYDMGCIPHRWFEVVLGGCILLVSSELYGVKRYMNKAFIVDDSEHLEERVNFFNDKIKQNKLIEAHEYQKNFIYKYYSSERNVDAIFGAIGR